MIKRGKKAGRERILKILTNKKKEQNHIYVVNRMFFCKAKQYLVIISAVSKFHYWHVSHQRGSKNVHKERLNK